jgi:beta-glucanase (GH16 family)
MSDPYGPSSYGPSDRRRSPGPWDHHAETRDPWVDDAAPRHQLPEPHGSPDPGWAAEPHSSPNPGWAAEPHSSPNPGWATEPTGRQIAEPYDPWGSDGLPVRRADGYNDDAPSPGGRSQGGYGPGGYGEDGYGSGGYGSAEPYPGGEPRRGGRSPRLVMGAAAAGVVLVLVAAFAILEMRGHGNATDTSNAALNQGAALAPSSTTNVAPADAYPSSAAASSKPSPSKSATSKAAAKTDPPKTGASGGGGVPAPPAGFTLTFSDSFDGAAGTGLSSKYRYDTGPGSKFGTGEIETMTDSTKNVFHDGDGHLILKAVHSGSDPGSGWTSGRFETNSDSFGAPEGGKVRMQASIEQPNVTTSNGAGYWPAFWMLGNGLRNGGNWPKIGEVDILEDINGRSSVFGTLHCGSNPGGPCNESSGIGSGEKACAGCQTGFHTYAVEIDRSSSPEHIRWFEDGKNYFTLAQDRVDASTWSNAVDHPFFVIFDLAMGGGFPAAFGGGPNGNTVSGGEMKIDYLAVYNSK